MSSHSAALPGKLWPNVGTWQPKRVMPRGSSPASPLLEVDRVNLTNCHYHRLICFIQTKIYKGKTFPTKVSQVLSDRQEGFVIIVLNFTSLIQLVIATPDLKHSDLLLSVMSDQHWVRTTSQRTPWSIYVGVYSIFTHFFQITVKLGSSKTIFLSSFTLFNLTIYLNMYESSANGEH